MNTKITVHPYINQKRKEQFTLKIQWQGLKNRGKEHIGAETSQSLDHLPLIFSVGMFVKGPKIKVKGMMWVYNMDQIYARKGTNQYDYPKNMYICTLSI